MNNYFTKTLLLILVPILFFFSAGLNQTAHACSCAEGTIRNDFEREHTVIFSGKVTNIKEQQRSYLVSFEINQAWKDLPNDVKSINTSTPQSSSMCGYGFTEDESYLVVASDPWTRTKQNVLKLYLPIYPKELIIEPIAAHRPLVPYC